jgi:AcrR family transcriptional regulator
MARGKDLPTAARARRRETRRESLLAAAHALAAREGADALDPAAVAAEAGVSRPLFYAHFPTRADFVDALLSSLHEESAPLSAAPAAPGGAVLAFFERLAEPLDRHAELARRIIPASHLPGPVAAARARRRERAIARLADLLPAATPDREARAAFLMDAFLGVQLAWSKSADAGSLVSRVRRDLSWALAGVLAPASSSSP